MAELRTDLRAIRSDLHTLHADLQYVKGRLDAIPPTLDADLQYVKGRLDAMPTTIQLLGFVLAIFVAAGVTRFFGH